MMLDAPTEFKIRICQLSCLSDAKEELEFLKSPEAVDAAIHSYMNKLGKSAYLHEYLSIFQTNYERKLAQLAERLNQGLKVGGKSPSPGQNYTLDDAWAELHRFVKKVKDDAESVYLKHRKKPRKRTTGLGVHGITQVPANVMGEKGAVYFRLFIITDNCTKAIEVGSITHHDSFKKGQIGNVLKEKQGFVSGLQEKLATPTLEISTSSSKKGPQPKFAPTKGDDPYPITFSGLADNKKHAEDFWFPKHLNDLEIQLKTLKEYKVAINWIEVLVSVSPCPHCRENYFNYLHKLLKMHYGGLPVYIFTFRDDNSSAKPSNSAITIDLLERSIYLLEAGGNIRRIGVWKDGSESIWDDALIDIKELKPDGPEKPKGNNSNSMEKSKGNKK